MCRLLRLVAELLWDCLFICNIGKYVVCYTGLVLKFRIKIFDDAYEFGSRAKMFAYRALRNIN